MKVVTFLWPSSLSMSCMVLVLFLLCAFHEDASLDTCHYSFLANTCKRHLKQYERTLKLEHKKKCFRVHVAATIGSSLVGEAK